MNRKVICAALATAMASGLHATTQRIEVTAFSYAGPFKVENPFMLDSVDVNSKKFDNASLLKIPVSLKLTDSGRAFSDAVLPASEGNNLHLLSFTIDNERYFNGSLKISGLKNKEIYLDGKPLGGEKLTLTPATHNITVKCLSLAGEQADSIKVAIESDGKSPITINGDKMRRYTLHDVMTGRRIMSAIPSPNGKYLITCHSLTHDGGASAYSYDVSELSSGRKLFTRQDALAWMPQSDILYFTRTVSGKMQLVTINPANGEENVLAEDLPSKSFAIAPTGNFLIYTKFEDGPKEKSEDLYEIVNPEDRQPGWRRRGSLMKYDMATGLSTRLTFGYRNVNLSGISDDGSKILFTAYDTRLEKRPTSVTSIYLMDLNTRQCDALAENEGFIGAVALSPDGKQIAIQATPEAFNSIGKNLPEGMTPSMYDYQLYLMDADSKKITPLTRDFNPSVDNFIWSRTDGQIYFFAENRDRRDLYRVNPSNGKIEDLKTPEEYVTSFSLSESSPILVYTGQGASNSDRLYALNLKTKRHTLIEDLSAERLAGIKLGECHQWDFLSSRGDSICGRYILPPDFDKSKKYPLIVNYYGGCSPTSRYFESRYPHHVYAAHGYVVLVITPSGSTGFGQEYAGRHVNTAGEGVADDIIDGVKAFVKENNWIDSSKIGCIGASYGGFMTQYLQTKTDIFTAAISHAGISDHTSYWGEGYWGYSYSEVCMANSYPWTRKDLFIDRSPLFNADKIHTPILFLHGDHDTNVPIGESIQMYTALKLLGRETAFVAVKDANHQVVDFNKRKQWQETIFAWFAKYLQDDPSWWESLYPTKSL